MSAATSAADCAAKAASDNNTLLGGLYEFMKFQQEAATQQSRQQAQLMEQLILVQKEQHATKQGQNFAPAASPHPLLGAAAPTLQYPAAGIPHQAPSTPSMMAPKPLMQFSPWNGEDSLYHPNGEMFIARQAPEGAIVPAPSPAMAGIIAPISPMGPMQQAGGPAQQPVLPTAIPGVRREVTRDTLSNSHIHKLDMEGKTPKNKFWKNVRAQERCRKIDKDIEADVVFEYHFPDNFFAVKSRWLSVAQEFSPSPARPGIFDLGMVFSAVIVKRKGALDVSAVFVF